jgi:hypothetical protein
MRIIRSSERRGFLLMIASRPKRPWRKSDSYH